jgi:hypothetical protein
MVPFSEWLVKEAEIPVMILPWPKIKKMGLDKFASGEASKGAYLDASKFDFRKPNFEDALLNNKFYETGSILPGYIDISGVKHPPQFKVEHETSDFKTLKDLKRPGTRLIKINMITNQGTNKKWKWESFAKGFKLKKDYYQITSVEMGDHYFCLDLFLWTPFMLQNYPGGEPRNRPSTYGNLSFGKIIGQVRIGGYPPRDLYDSIAIN